MSRLDRHLPLTIPHTTTGFDSEGGIVKSILHDRPARAPAWKDPVPRRQRQQAIIVPTSQPPKDRDAFVAWVDRQWGGFIQKELSRRKGLSWESTRDLHQVVLLIVSDHFDKQVAEGKPGSPENVPGFLASAIDYAAANHVRHEGRRPRLEGGVEVEEEPDAAPDPEQAAMLAEMREELARYGAELTPEEAEVVEARELDGMSFEVIATAIGISKMKVWRRHHDAMTKLEKRAQESERGTTLGGRVGRALPGDHRVKRRAGRPLSIGENSLGRFRKTRH